MVGHIALPCYETEKDEYGYMPATLSKSLIQGLLKDKLGYRGCVVLDAMSMVGVCSRKSIEERIVGFFNSGGDFYLFPTIEEYRVLVNAVRTGEVSIDRIKDAVKRVIRLKERAGLFDEERKIVNDISEDVEELNKIADEIAEKAVKIVRDNKGVIKEKIKKLD